ncbi:hypothetical protein DVH24_036694 [Malus domestica]|uniref:Uncharacterized protein n=1 Tax=Malus domestica TaxID=3750 RepID=A0A498IMA4_MALDO|nr:hypothetical protein DVH24_036694 [Malus domestica]
MAMAARKNKRNFWEFIFDRILLLISKKQKDYWMRGLGVTNAVVWIHFAVESDINCLKSLKALLQDPLGYLNSSWDFNNKTEDSGLL